MAINMMCMNSNCLFYWEDCCTKSINETRIVIDGNGQCETFELGISEWYNEPQVLKEDIIESRFEIGNEVLVISDNGCHTTYPSFFKENNLTEFEGKYDYGVDIPLDEIYIIVAEGKSYTGEEMVVLLDYRGLIYLMDKDVNDIKEVEEDD